MTSLQLPGFIRTSAFVSLGLIVALGAGRTRAQTALTAPAGFQPGWQIEVRKDSGDIDRPIGSVLTTFAAPAAGFDMASYRDATMAKLDFGLAYDAKGELTAVQAGHYRIVVTTTWSSGNPESAAAHCNIRLSLDDKTVADWRGLIPPDSGSQPAEGDIDLQFGSHPVELRVSCDQPLGARLQVAIGLKGPADADIRPLGPVDIVHPAPAVSTIVPTPGVAPATESAPPPTDARTDQATTTLVATIDLSIRERPDRKARRLARLVIGQRVEVVGLAADPDWYQLSDGGFVEAAFLKPPGSAGPARPIPQHHGPIR